jgi:hypothetical protein
VRIGQLLQISVVIETSSMHYSDMFSHPPKIHKTMGVPPSAEAYVFRRISKNLAFGLYPSSNVFFPLKTTFRELALLPSSGKKGEVIASTLWDPLQRASLNHWTPSHQRSKTYKHLTSGFVSGR